MDVAGEVAVERTRLAYRLMAVPFAGVAVFYGTVVVANLAAQQIRSGVILYVLLTGAAAIGLAAVKAWGRSLALVVSIGNAGIATLALLASILGEGSPVAPGVFLVASVAAAALLTRPVFTLPEERS